MNSQTKLFVSVVLAAAAIAAAIGIGTGHLSANSAFLAYLALAFAGAVMKVRLPKMMGTFSLHFFFILLALFDLGYGAALLIGSISVIAQCCWRPAVPPKGIQVLFNMANIAISTAVAFFGTELAVSVAGLDALARMPAFKLTIAAPLFFLTNTLLVSAVLAFSERKSMGEFWERWFFCSFPYYCSGTLVAAVLTNWMQGGQRMVVLFLLPLMYLVHRYYRVWVQRLAAVA